MRGEIELYSNEKKKIDCWYHGVGFSGIVYCPWRDDPVT